MSDEKELAAESPTGEEEEVEQTSEKEEEQEVEENDEADDVGEKVKDEVSGGRRMNAFFAFSFALTAIFLIASMVLVLFWVIMYRDGFGGRDEPKKEFNIHPVLMIAGFIFFSGFSMLFYRLMTCCRKIIVKLFHSVFHVLSIACIAVGFLAVWDTHQTQGIPDFYSLHSWLGLTTMALFAIQFIVGFFSFLVLLCCESRTAACRASLVPTHATFGIITFVMAAATAVTGLTEKVFFTIGADQYSKWVEEGIIVNALGVTLIGSMILMVWFLRTTPIRRGSAVLSERL